MGSPRLIGPSVKQFVKVVQVMLDRKLCPSTTGSALLKKGNLNGNLTKLFRLDHDDSTMMALI
jgi:hypothetical protein